jgi:hypothetical protein
MQYEFKIKHFGEGYYTISYKRKPTSFLEWLFLSRFKILTYCCEFGRDSIIEPDRHQPMFYKNFNKAVEKAKYFKENPLELMKFIRDQDNAYILAIKERREYQESLNKSVYLK